MTTVMPPEVQAYIDGIRPGHRSLFERLHRLILTAHPGALVTLSYKMPACKAGNRRLYARAPGTWGYWYAAGRKTATAASPPAAPNWSPARRTLQLRDGGAAGISDEDFLGLARRPGPLTRTRQLRAKPRRVTSGRRSRRRHPVPQRRSRAGCG